MKEVGNVFEGVTGVHNMSSLLTPLQAANALHLMSGGNASDAGAPVSMLTYADVC
jgi:hypothetical protein